MKLTITEIGYIQSGLIREKISLENEIEYIRTRVKDDPGKIEVAIQEREQKIKEIVNLFNKAMDLWG